MLTVLKCFKFYSERVSMGRALDLPVFFGDAGSREVHPNILNSLIVLKNDSLGFHNVTLKACLGQENLKATNSSFSI